jgi:AraC family transcriptional regulator, ethanolamine operon transcriptional activator
MPVSRGPAAPADPVLAFTQDLSDFDQLAAFFVGWEGRFEQLSSGRFEGSLSVVRGRTVRLVSVACNQSILARGRRAPGLFTLYTVNPSNAGGIWQGRRLDPGQWVVHGPEADSNHRTARRFTSAGLSVAAPEMEEAARGLLATDIAAWPQSWEALTPPPEHASELTTRTGRLLRLALADPTILSAAEGRQFEQECLRAAVKGIAPVACSRHGLPPLGARAVLVRRAEELMRTHLDQPLGAIDLCQALGVSDRTLRLAFRERFGLGPMAYYRVLRLNAARAVLKADPARAVAEVARGFGFHHLGHFAADYRRLFGERPSATRGVTRPPRSRR